MENPDVEGYLPKKSQTDDFNPWRTLPEPYFVSPESLVVPFAVVFSQFTSKQTDKQTNWFTCYKTPTNLWDSKVWRCLLGMVLREI